MGRNFTRRQIVAGAAVLGGTLALAGCAQPQQKKQGDTGADKESVSVDLIVVGSGLAGLACSTAAAEKGAPGSTDREILWVRLWFVWRQAIHRPPVLPLLQVCLCGKPSLTS